MTEIGIFEAKTKLSELITQVEEGAVEYVITRRGRPVARITGLSTEGNLSSGLLKRMAQTEAEFGKIADDEIDFPDVWLERRSDRSDPMDEDS